MDTLIYIANAIYLVSYLVRDILHLRLLTIAAATCLALYFGSRAEPLMEVVWWNLLFLVLNACQIGYILWERSGSDDASEPANPPADTLA